MEFKRKRQELAGRQREIVESFITGQNVPTSLHVEVNIPVRDHFGMRMGPEFLKVEQLEALLRTEGFDRFSYLPSSNGYEPCIQGESQRQNMEGSYIFKLRGDTERKSGDNKYLPFKFDFKGIKIIKQKP